MNAIESRGALKARAERDLMERYHDVHTKEGVLDLLTASVNALIQDVIPVDRASVIAKKARVALSGLEKI